MLASTERDQIHSSVPADERAVGHRENRRRIDEDEVVPRRHVREERLEARATDELGGIRRQLARGDEGEVLVWRLADRIGRRDLPADDLGDAWCPLSADIPVQSPSPQIAVDEEDTFSRRREHLTEVQAEDGLPDAG